MFTHVDIEPHKKAVVFGLDDVLFPKKDYLLQVYYLFANLLEYTETVPPADDLTAFLKKAYEHQGETDLFERAAEVFGIDAKYKASFDRLHVTAKLPLKLLLYRPMLDLMQELNSRGTLLLVLTPGNPAMQLNKLGQVAWNGLERVLKVYFDEELAKGDVDPFSFLLADNGLLADQALYIHAGNTAPAGIAGVEAVHVSRFLGASADLAY
ncbi:FMN phosphatase YigB, HAD superfamily [Parapedobacter composti]|uniref:FMN phosphatase YigB, HAD superfamily n=1 Tax=Parapedobacter composti TaxID=623281 RepID=A0A1I1H9A1_9SPHI|nr:hypothetical protein [Parapedobacter composti]SFC20336.1 FMN phosphatase YigB, HAD superfamily [Parapedobacter composti]